MSKDFFFKTTDSPIDFFEKIAVFITVFSVTAIQLFPLANPPAHARLHHR